MKSIENINQRNKAEVETLCDRLGYGYVLQQASILWIEGAASKGYPSAGQVIGPHVGLTEPCQCADKFEICDWCCGCEWLTPKVAALQRAENGQAIALQSKGESCALPPPLPGQGLGNPWTH